MKDKALTMKDRFFWFGLIILGSILVYWFTHPWNMVSFGLLWWCIGISPFLNFMKMSQEIAERYAYLPCAGLMFVLASILVNYPAAAAFFLGMYATKLWFYMDAYQDDFYILEHACLNSPGSWFAWHVRGHKRWDHKSYMEAIIMWTMARLLSPKEFKVNFNLATACAVIGHKKEALEWLKIAKDNIPAGQEEMTKELFERWHKDEKAILL